MFPQDRITQFCLLILTAIALTSSLIYMRAIAVPFTISLFLFSALSPLIKWTTQKLKLSHTIAVVLTLCGFLVFSALTVLLLVDSIQSFVMGIEIYRDRFYDFVDLILDTAKKFDLAIDRNSIRENIRDLPIFDLVTSFTGNIFSILGNAVLIVVFVMFMLTGKKDTESEKSPLILEIEEKISQYTLAKIFISAATGISAAILFSLLDMELVLMFSVLTFLLNFIPNIGSLVAIAIPLPIALLQFGFTTKFYILLIIFSFLQFFWGNIIEPKLLGDTLDLHPNTILISLVFWGIVWGVPGMFLAVPITAVLKIVLSQIPVARSFSELMAGRF